MTSATATIELNRPAPAHVPPGYIRDLDIASPAFAADPFGAFQALARSSEDRIVYSPNKFFGGWFVSRFEDVLYVLQNPALFSSDGIARVVDRESQPDRDGPQSFRLVPLELDPPIHARYRAMLNPMFSPKEVDRLEADIRAITVDLVDRVAGAGRCEIIADLARPLPTTIFLRMMGLPLDRVDEFVGYTLQLLHSRDEALEADATRKIGLCLQEMLGERMAAPRDDLMSKILALKLDGDPIPPADIMGFCFLLFVAGLDTVTSTLGHFFQHLAQAPADRQALVNDPGRIPLAVEELLRAYSAVTTSRFATRDLELAGAPIRRGDRVMVLLPAANRDPAEFERPETVDFAREAHRHLAFASGPHRCIGSHLARRELRIALEEFLKRIPDFRLDPARPLSLHSGAVIGHDRLDLVWDV